MSRRRHLHPKRRKVKCPRSHGHVICFLQGFRKAAGMLSWRRVGVHGDVILIQLLTRHTSHRGHTFDFKMVMEAFKGIGSVSGKGPGNIIAVLGTGI